MYYYIYDSFLSDKKFSNVLAKIETRLTDLGINGKINHLSFLKNIHQIILEEVRRGVKTIVVIGNDRTLAQIINIIADLNVTLGYIPIGSENIARLLHIPEGEAACDILSARIVKRVDIGKVGNYYFLTSIETGNYKLVLECDNNYFINLEEKNTIVNISNLNVYNQFKTLPNDEYLDIFIEHSEKKFLRKGTSSTSRLVAKKIKITSDKSVPIFLSDEKKIIKTPAEITVQPKKLRLIVGKRAF